MLKEKMPIKGQLELVESRVGEGPNQLFTCYSSHFIGGVASSKPCHMSAKAVANQVQVFQRDVGGLLKGVKNAS